MNRPKACLIGTETGWELALFTQQRIVPEPLVYLVTQGKPRRASPTPLIVYRVKLYTHYTVYLN